jgi:hypothetical protein
MTTLQLHCKSCGKLIPAQDVNIDKAIAKCLACHAVFRFADELASGAAAARPQVGLPARCTLDNWGPELTITRRWYSHALWFLVFFCIVWDGFLVAWYTMGIKDLLAGKGGMVWVMLLFPVLHLAVGVGLTYFVVAAFVNKTVVRIAGGELSVRHGPFPWPGNRAMPTADLKQLLWWRPASAPPRCMSSGSRSCRGESTPYKMKLVESLEELDQALFIEQEVERHLKIPDERVPGEVRV